MRIVLLAVVASSFAGAAMAAPEVMGPAHPATPQPPAACAKLKTRTVAPDGVPLFKRLDQLPRAVLEHAVWRKVEGCPVREILYKGATWYVFSANPKLDSGPLVAQHLRKYH